MGASIVTRLTAVSGSGLIVYDIMQSTTLAFLEETKDIGVYQLVLKEGQFRRVWCTPGLKGFDAELAMGSMVHGYVIGSLSDHAAKGVKQSDFLVLRVKANIDTSTC